MKLDNKGFAISGILYAVMILFLTLVVSLLAMISNRKLALDKYKKEVKEEINEAIETYGARVQISPDTTYVRINEEEIIDYDFKTKVSGCVKGNSSSNSSDTLCQENETDITNLLSYKIYDEVGNEVINFEYDVLMSSDGFKVYFIRYKYYEKDSKGNYVLDATNKNLKTVSKKLSIDSENIFYIRYYVVDNNNVLSKEATRTLVIKRYSNYINVTTNYFKINKDGVNSYNFASHASSYKYENNNIVKDDSILRYALYNEDDEAITNFHEESGILFYRINSVDKKVTPDEKFRIRYFTGSIDDPTSEINFAYFTVE